MPMTEVRTRPVQTWITRIASIIAIMGLLAVLVAGLQGCINVQAMPIGMPALPEFPWPPPTPTTDAQIPEEFGIADGNGRTYGNLADRLESALTKSGYNEKTFYSVPGGFALVCRLEQVDGNWTPMPPPQRWGESPPPLRSFSLTEYLQRLFLAQPGHYRLLVFIVNNTPWVFAPRTPTKEEGKAWLFGGATRLPEEMAQTPAPSGTTCFALVYEFEKDDDQAAATFVRDKTVGALIQLKRAGLF